MPAKKKSPQSIRQRLHGHRIALAVLVGVIAVPTAMTGLFQSIDDDGINSVPVIDLRHRAARDADRVRQLRRDYWQAVDIYNELNRLGIDNPGPPDINNQESIEYYLTPDNFVGTEVSDMLHASAEEEEAPALQPITQAEREYSALPEIYRDLMDGYLTTSRCPGTLRQFHLAGFYDLCLRLLDERTEATAPRLNYLFKKLDGFHSLGVAPLRNLGKRLESLQDSLLYEGGTSVRPKTHDGSGRPRLDYRHLRDGR